MEKNLALNNEVYIGCVLDSSRFEENSFDVVYGVKKGGVFVAFEYL